MVSASRLFFRAALVFMATVAVILSGGRAAAQGGPQWQPGVTLATLGGDAATTATIRIVTGQQPMSYRIGDMATVSFSMMDTRGEELIRFLPQSLGGTSHIFESRAGTFALEPRSSGLVLAALQTSGNGTGTAIMRISDIDGGTTPTLLRSLSGIGLQSRQGNLFLQVSATQAFRGPDGRDGAWRIVAPLQPNNIVRFSISTEEKSPKDIDSGTVGGTRSPIRTPRPTATPRAAAVSSPGAAPAANGASAPQ